MSIETLTIRRTDVMESIAARNPGCIVVMEA